MNTRAANARGTAPAQHSQEEAHRLGDALLSQLACGTGLLERCRDWRRRTPRDAPMHWFAARIIGADAVLGTPFQETLAPRRKAKRKPSAAGGVR